MATELFSATFDSAADLASYDLRTSGNSDTQIVTENGNGVLDIGLDRFADAVSYRSEVELAGRNPARFAEIGKTYTYSFDMRLGANWVHDDRPEILFQLHSSPDEGDGSRSPLLALQLMPSQDHSTTYYSIVQRADDRAISEGMPSSHVTTTVGRIDGDIGDWVNWTFQIHFSPENDGWLTVWKDGVIVLQQEGQANCFNDAVGPYAKWGVYKWDWESGTSIASSRSVQYDNLRIVEGDDAPVPADSAPLDSTQLSEALALASGGHAYSQYLDAVDQANGGVSMKGDFGDGTLIGTPFDDNLQDSWAMTSCTAAPETTAWPAGWARISSTAAPATTGSSSAMATTWPMARKATTRCSAGPETTSFMAGPATTRWTGGRETTRSTAATAMTAW